MTPKEKAQEIFNKMYEVEDIMVNYPMCFDTAKQCALVAVDEIINSTPLEPNFADWDDCGGEHRYWYDAQKTHAFHFWQEVKKEIEKL